MTGLIPLSRVENVEEAIKLSKEIKLCRKKINEINKRQTKTMQTEFWCNGHNYERVSVKLTAATVINILNEQIKIYTEEVRMLGYTIDD